MNESKNTHNKDKVILIILIYSKLFYDVLKPLSLRS